MKNTVQSVILGVALFIGALQTHAATAAKTNWVQTLNIKLQAFQEGQAKATAITTKSLVSALGGGTTSKLVVEATGTNTLFLLRTGTTNTDVTTHFALDHGTPFGSTTGAVTTRHRLDTFHFTSATLKFDLTGLTTETRSAVVKNGPVVTKALSAVVSGEGVIGTGLTNNAVMSGTITTTGRLE